MSQQPEAAIKPAPDLQKIAELINTVIFDQRNTIVATQALFLRDAALELSAAAGAAA
jgi:hypothetical protein